MEILRPNSSFRAALNLFVQVIFLLWQTRNVYEDIIAEKTLNEALRKEIQHLKVVTGQNLTNDVPMVEFRPSFGPNHQVHPKNQAVQTMLMPQQIQQRQDDEVIKAVVSVKTPSYSLESKLGDCKRAAFIRRVALERITGKFLDGLPLEGFDYESMLGQCCEMPVVMFKYPLVLLVRCCWMDRSLPCP